MQNLVWQARIPLEIRLAPSESRTFDKADPYMVSAELTFRVDRNATVRN